MDNCYSVVITACTDDSEAKIIIDSLLNKKLAACIQVFHASSHYVWKDEIVNEPESILFIKCKSENFDKIKEEIEQKHSYEVPEIIKIPIEDASQEYLNWINAVSI